MKNIFTIIVVCLVWGGCAPLFSPVQHRYTGELYVTTIKGTDVVCKKEYAVCEFTTRDMETPLVFINATDTIQESFLYSTVDFKYHNPTNTSTLIIGSKSDIDKGFILSVTRPDKTIVVGTKCNP